MEPTFSELIQRIRGGDSEATSVLVSTYEPAIRRSLRMRMAARSGER